MNPIILHLLDSLHDWSIGVCVVSCLATIGAQIWREWLQDFAEDSDFLKDGWPNWTTGIAIVVAVLSFTLVQFVPTSESWKHATKAAYCLDHPGKCK
jgi:hypothetical protein